MTAPLKVFVSYAHADEAHRETLANHLSALEDEGLIAVWHDRQITGGREWAGAIDEALHSADIVLLLISADFLDSDYCNDVELTEAIRRHDATQARVVPVILRSCDWKHSRFARFNALPPDGVPVVEAEHPDQRFLAVAEGLRAIVAELTNPDSTTTTRSPMRFDASPTTSPAPGTEVSSTNAGARHAPSAGDAAATAPKPKRLTIGKISLFGFELGGPFEIPLPQHSAKPLLLGLCILVLLGGGVYFFALSSPLTQARDAMRMARYDIALEALDTVPAWLRNWPAWAALRAKADLGARTYQSPPDWESIGEDLRRQRADRPTDADLMILEAQYWLRQENYDQARTLAEAASKEDQHNAEAWFLLGLDRDLSGDTAAAVAYYRKAVEAAPASPQYRSNLARGLLELGTFPEALQEYRKIRQFPLARVEQALAHWAQGEMREAADAERDALKMLGDAGLSTRFYNRRAWLFRLPTKGIRLSSPEDKRCYALLGEAASRRLAGEAVAAFPPAECYDPPLAIRELLADDLCRFVDRPQLTLSAAARSLRQRLAMPEDCTGSARNPKSNQPASSLTNSLGMQFALIPAGEFQMGSANGSDNERPVHTVRISKPFYLGIYEVTQDQWEAVMGHNPSRFKGDGNRPVEMVSWEEVQKFIDELNTREGGAKYRLPMEAEWEYAARAGSQTAYSFGDDSRQLGKYGWFRGNADNTTHPVGTLQPNAWGLYDMHGNVWEWVQDWRGQYPAGPVTDPQGPASGSARVIRGGWWSGEAMRCRPAYREAGAPDYRNDDLGFRLLRTAP